MRPCRIRAPRPGPLRPTGGPASAPSSASSKLLPAAPRRAASALALPETLRGRLSDREFLAPALEILETPASPVHLAFLWIICALVVVGIAWAYFGRIDIIASAQGKFQPTGRVKVIEPLDTGRVAAIRATNGSSVAEGDVLIELDRSAAEADLTAAKEALASARAETLRRQAALAAAKARAFTPPASIDWPADVAPALRERENRVLSADLGQLAATLASFDAQRAQKTAERDMLLQTIETQKNLVATLQQRVDMRTRLVEFAVGRQGGGDRRDRDAAISADPARDPSSSSSPRCRPASTSSTAIRRRRSRPSCRTTRRSSTTRSAATRTRARSSPRRRPSSTT